SCRGSICSLFAVILAPAHLLRLFPGCLSARLPPHPSSLRLCHAECVWWPAAAPWPAAMARRDPVAGAAARHGRCTAAADAARHRAAQRAAAARHARHARVVGVAAGGAAGRGGRGILHSTACGRHAVHLLDLARGRAVCRVVALVFFSVVLVALVLL